MVLALEEVETGRCQELRLITPRESQSLGPKTVANTFQWGVAVDSARCEHAQTALPRASEHTQSALLSASDHLGQTSCK